MPVIIGIDPGTKCGWAVREPHGVTSAGTWNLKGGRYEGCGMRFLRLRGHLAELFRVVPPTVVAFEEVRAHKGTDAAHIYGGVVAVIASMCEEAGIPYCGVPVATVKKQATGKGNSNKAHMLAAAKGRWPNFDGDDNEADARWIAETAWAAHTGGKY